MKRSAYSMLTFLCVVAVIAVDIVLLRIPIKSDSASSFTREWWVAVAMVPMGTLLLFVVAGVGFDVWRCGEARPFAFGVAAFGLASLVLATLVLGDFPRMDAYLRFVFGRISPAANWQFVRNGYESTDGLVVGLGLIALVVPQVAFALVGGALASWSGVTLVSKRRQRVLSQGRTDLSDPTATVVS